MGKRGCRSLFYSAIRLNPWMMLLLLLLLNHHASAASFNYKDALSKSLLYFKVQRSGHLPYDQRSAVSFNYKDALTKSLLYFEAQRSGHLPYNQRLKWRGHSALTDGLQEGVELVGGYYDAGDHVKFGLPMAFTMTMLSWAAIECGEALSATREYEHVLEAIKWGTDYFIKAHTQANVLWAQVGDADVDHLCWQRPEDMTTSRRAYKIDAQNPGSEVAGETAAALAAASIVFNVSNPHYSCILLHHAQQLFEFGDKYRGTYNLSVKAAKGYYPSSSGYGDELLWAAMWLHLATGKVVYLDYVVEKANEFGGPEWAVAEFSWDIKYAGVQILASKLLMERGNQLEKIQSEMLDRYQSKAVHYLCSNLGKNNRSNVQRTPGGLLIIHQWNNMQYVSSATFLLTAYSDYLTRENQELKCPDGSVKPHELLAFAKLQADYILGSNPMNMSYLVGFGSKYPTRVHHRGASMVSYNEDKNFIGCAQGYYKWFGQQKDNPIVLVGALVGGPDFADEFTDMRGNYKQTEPPVLTTRLQWLECLQGCILIEWIIKLPRTTRGLSWVSAMLLRALQNDLFLFVEQA